jgi:uncharacterized protein (TIGR02145 family)
MTNDQDYFNIDPADGSERCSDNSCPCDETRLKKDNIYLYISPDLIKFRKDCKSISEASQKLNRMQASGIMVDGSLFIPVVCCETAIAKRGLDKKTAHKDAVFWYDTGKVPLRATPKADAVSKISAEPVKSPFACNAPQIEIGKETIIDIDGNVYHTVKIGNQVWTVENLRTTKYNDGSIIRFEGEEEYSVDEEYETKFLGIFTAKKVRQIKKTRNISTINNDCWSKLTEGAICWYGNNSTNKDKYGILYNWYAVNTGKLAPKDWHVPTDTEWSELENYLIANGYNWNGTKEGNKIAKSMAANTDWKSDSGSGAIGNDLSKNNRCGFSALPVGYRSGNGSFYCQSDGATWWSATEGDVSIAWGRCLLYGYGFLDRYNYNKGCGFSVRLLRD